MKAYIREKRKMTRSVRYTWLISYITILAIPLLLSGILFVGVERLVNRKITDMNGSIVAQLRGTLDTMFESIYKSALQIQLSGPINNIIYSGEQLSSRDHYRLYELKEYLKQYTTYSDYVDEVIVYLEQSKYCVSSQSSYGPELFFEMLDWYDFSREEWEYLKSSTVPGFYILERTQKQESRVIYSAPLPVGVVAKTKGRILVIPKDRYFKQKVNQEAAMSKAVYLIDGENMMPLSDVPQWLRIESVSDFKEPQQNWIYSSLPSSVTTMEYLVVDQYRAVYRELNMIRMFLLGSIAFSMTLGIWMSVYFMKRNYVPVKELIASLMGNSQVKKIQAVNEYCFLSDAISAVIDNQQAVEWQLSLLKLLRGRDIPEAKRVLLTAKAYVVVAFAIEDASGFFGEDELASDNHRLLHFVVSNCSRDFFRDTARLFDVVELDHYLVQIVCFDQEQEDRREEVWQILEQIHYFFGHSLKIKLSISLGEFCYRPEDIGRSYEAAREALEYRVVMGNNVLIDSYQLTEFMLFYDYSLENEKDIINSLRNGNYEQSRDLVFQVIDGNLGTGMMSAQLARCMLFDLVATVMKALSLTRLDSNFLGQINPIERLFQCETFAQMKYELSDILRAVCDYINKNGNGPNQEVFDRLVTYLDSHYMEENLNVTVLTAELFISKTFLLKLFKDYTGLTPLDYINRLRCERAAVMLGSSDRTIEEIAARVGYSGSHSFIRVFKKLYGKTPGAYRSVLTQEEQKRKI